MTERKANTGLFRHHSDTMRLIRVAGRQFPKLDPEDRAALRKFVERDMAELASPPVAAGRCNRG